MVKINTGALIEFIFLFLVFGIMLNAGCGVLFDHKIIHGYPYGLLASDAFQHQTRAESIKDMGNYRNEVFYIAHGYKDVIGYYMPVFYHLGVLLSYSAGIESWDATYFILFFSSCIAALIMYIVLRDINKHVAILSLPLSILVFSKVPYIGYTWGQWPNIFALFFLTAFFWSVYKIDLKYSYIFIGLFLAAVALTHTSIFIFAMLFLVFNFAMLFSLKRLNKGHIKKFLLALLIFLVLGSYFLIIFQQTWLKISPYTFSSITQWPGGSGSFNFFDFKLMMIPIFIGIIASFFMLRKAGVSAAFFGIFIIFWGYSNYFGFEHRAFTLRIFWPIFLSVFFGVGIYSIITFFFKKWKWVYSVVLSITILIALNSAFAQSLIPHPAKFTSNGIMDEYHWDTLRWIEEKTPEDAKIYFFYGDPNHIYRQDAMLRNDKRENYMVEIKSVDSDVGLIDAFYNNTIRRFYRTRNPGDSGGGLPYRTSFLRYSFHTEEDNFTSWYKTSRDICGFDYYVFDKYSSQPGLEQYTIQIMQEMMKSGNLVPMYENQVSYILKNNKPGEDCIGKKN